MSHPEKHGICISPIPYVGCAVCVPCCNRGSKEKGRCSSRSHAYSNHYRREQSSQFQGLLPPSLLQGHYRTLCGAFVEQSTLEH